MTYTANSLISGNNITSSRFYGILSQYSPRNDTISGNHVSSSIVGDINIAYSSNETPTGKYANKPGSLHLQPHRGRPRRPHRRLREHCHRWSTARSFVICILLRQRFREQLLKGGNKLRHHLACLASRKLLLHFFQHNPDQSHSELSSGR